jgi:hypothetical protein
MKLLRVDATVVLTPAHQEPLPAVDRRWGASTAHSKATVQPALPGGEVERSPVRVGSALTEAIRLVDENADVLKSVHHRSS